MARRVADRALLQHLNLVAFADENEIPAAFIALNLSIKANTFANKLISESRNRVAVPLDGDLAFCVQQRAELD